MPRIFLAFLVMLALGLSAGAADAAQKKRSTQSNPRYASIVMDADSGAILHERYADKKLHPASLVKMMTLLMAFERLESGQMTLNQRIRISPHAAAQSPSKLGLKAGSTISVKDAIYALVTKSANDIAVAMGEHIGGTESQFAAMMTRRARELGMNHTVFKNASGLHHADQVSSARDMARLGRILIKQHTQNYKYFSTRNFNFNGTSMHNHNRLMETYDGMDGIKTGYINASGFNLAASAVRGDRRLIAVVFGGRTTASRNAHVASLLDQGFDKLGISKNAPRVAAASSIKPPPVPGRKPDIGTTRLAGVLQDEMAMTGAMGEMAGEGDIDPAIAKRFETGMMAIAAIKDEINPAGTAHIARRAAQNQQKIALNNATGPTHTANNTPNIALNNTALDNNEWAIQVGAFTSRVRSDQALNEAIKRLPTSLQANARPVIVPLQAGDGWVFRARIRGLSREQAASACQYFNNCMAISPRAF